MQTVWSMARKLDQFWKEQKMTNAEKFKTAEERARAFGKWHEEYCGMRGVCAKDDVCAHTVFHWLDLEAEEEIEDCPYCGRRCVAVDGSKIRPDRHGVRPYSYVKCESCGYESIATNDYDKSGIKDIIDAHNRVARAVMEVGKKKEEDINAKL